MRPSPGDVVGGKYRIVRLIGDGGMGAVYEARHELLGTNVALKFLHSELSKRPGLASRFLQEARVSARIQSPHVTRVTDVDQTPDGSPFLVMELLTGESLQQLLDRRVKLPKDQAIDFALQILSGLEAAHALGVVHRDLKPDNVFITPSTGGPLLKLLDFGIAKLREANEYQKGLTRPGAIMGTPEYMAPEQLYSADRVDHRADLYSLGVMLYEMLTGERPAYGDDAAAIVSQVAAGKVKRITEHDASLGEELAKVVHQAIDPESSRRFDSALSMRLALAPLSGELSHAGRLAATPAPAAVIPSPSEPPPKRQDKTADLPPLEPKAPSDEAPTRGGVAPTLPPDDDATAPAPPAPMAPVPVQPAPPPATAVGGDEPPKGGTQEASKELIAELAAQGARAQAVPAPHQQQMQRPAPPQQAHYVSAGYGAAPPPMPTRKRGGGGAIIALLLGVLVTGGAIALVVVLRNNKTDDPTPTNPLGEPTPTTTITAQGPDPNATTDVPPSPTPSPTPTPVPTKTSTGGGTPVPKKDAGTDAGKADAGTTAPFPTFPLPSGLPPLPSGLPPLPTFPQIPGFPPPNDQKK
ncbi:MAG: protein kinase [Myxococcales bacterium]|nr:protein kinase [Myxococcales bacterium]